MTRKELTIVIIGILGILCILIFTRLTNQIDTAQSINVIVTSVLVLITIIYVNRTAEIASETRKQAEATMKMAEEMKEQRIIESRPIIIQKAVVETETKYRAFGSKDWFSYFEVYNAGNGPAIELEISLMNNDKTPIHSQRKSFLRAGESPVEFDSKELSNFEESNFYLASEYKSILPTSQQPIWYQTWLPFQTSKASEKGRIYVIPGELEFREVSEKDRIDAFSSRSKPK